jgi:hypothetical protein
MKHEYREGKEAREAFNKGMKKLFQIPREAVKERPKPKRKKASKD